MNSRLGWRARILVLFGAGPPLVLAVAFATGLVFGPENPVRAAQTPQSAPRSVVANGTIEPVSEQVSVGNQVLGVLARVNVKEGDQVQAGYVVAETDNADLKAAVMKADATLDLQQAALNKLLNGARDEDRRRIFAEFKAAEAAASLEQMVVDRHRPLAKNNVIAAEDFERSVWTLASAQARRQAAQEALTLINAPPRPEDVTVARANVAIATADAATARAVLEKTRIRMPVDGTVLRMFRKLGEPVGVFPPTIIATVGDIRMLKVIAEIDESDVARVRPGQRAYATADAYMDQRFGGTVARLADSLGRKQLHSDDPAQRLDVKVLEVTITLDPGVHLPVGLRVDVFILDDEPRS